MRYTSRGLRRRRNTDKWEVTLSHKDPVTGERMTSYLGHANVAMTLNTYADVDPDAKRAAVSKVEDAFDVDMSRTRFFSTCPISSKNELA